MKYTISLVFYLLLVTACGESVTEEQQLIAAIRNMEAAAEAAERSTFMDYVADDFLGSNGMEKDMLRAVLIRQLNRYHKVRAQLGPIDVKIYNTEPLKAKADFKALLLGGGNWLPESGQWYQFNTGWRKQGGDWMMASAQWTPVVN